MNIYGYLSEFQLDLKRMDLSYEEVLKLLFDNYEEEVLIEEEEAEYGLLESDVVDGGVLEVENGSYSRISDIWGDSEVLHYLQTGLYHSNTRTTGQKRRVRKRAQNYEYRDQAIFWKAKGLLVPSPDQRGRLIDMYHGHYGHICGKLEITMRRTWFWTGMTLEIRERLRSCHVCLQSRRRFLQPLVLCQHQIPDYPFQCIGIDLAKFPLDSSGSRYVVVTVDYLSRWIELGILKDKHSDTISSWFLNHFLQKWPCPSTIRCDNGGEFKGSFALLVRSLNVVIRNGRPYHPQSQGLVERLVGRVRETIGKLSVELGEQQWPKLIDQVQTVLNCTPHISIRMSPFCVIHGYEPAPLFGQLFQFDFRVPHEWKTEEIGRCQDVCKSRLRKWQEVQNRKFLLKHKNDLPGIGSIVRISKSERKYIDDLLPGIFYVERYEPNGHYMTVSSPDYEIQQVPISRVLLWPMYEA